MKIHGLKVTGRKKEPVARVFNARENGVKPVKVAAEVEAVLKDEYSKKLVVDGRKMPDPFILKLKNIYILHSASVTNGSHKCRKDLFCCLATSGHDN